MIILGILDNQARNLRKLFVERTYKNYANYLEIIKKLPVIRIYHELTVLEDKLGGELSSIMDYVNVTAKISKLEASQLEVASKLCAARSDLAYYKFYSAVLISSSVRFSKSGSKIRL